MCDSRLNYSRETSLFVVIDFQNGIKKDETLNVSSNKRKLELH